MSKDNGNKAPAAPTLQLDQLGLRLMTKPIVGPTGHRVYFLGHHYDGKTECYDVGSARMDIRPIQIVRRHHHSKEEALITWEETTKKLKEIEEHPHEQDDRKLVLVDKRGKPKLS